MNIELDHHLFEAILLSGMVLDLPGGLYLAYDLLGQPSGILRRLLVVLTYLFIGVPGSVGGFLAAFAAIYWLSPTTIEAIGFSQVLGGMLGLGIGSGIGASLGYALNRSRAQVYIMRSQPKRLLNAIITGCVLGIIGGSYYGLIALQRMSFVEALGESMALGVAWAFIAGWLFAVLLLRRLPHDEHDSIPSRDGGGISVGFLVIAIIGIFALSGYWFAFGLNVAASLGFALSSTIGGAATAFFLASIQRIEWHVAHLPARSLGYLGLLLILVGFLVQSLQYIVPLLDIPVR